MAEKRDALATTIAVIALIVALAAVYYVMNVGPIGLAPGGGGGGSSGGTPLYGALASVDLLGGETISIDLNPPTNPPTAEIRVKFPRGATDPLFTQFYKRVPSPENRQGDLVVAIPIGTLITLTDCDLDSDVRTCQGKVLGKNTAAE